MRDSVPILPWVLAAGLLVGGCGPNELTGSSTVDVEGQGDAPRDVVVPLRKSGRSSAFELGMSSQPRVGGPPQVVYLNRDGATLTGGNDDATQNRSSIVDGRATIPRFTGSDATWTRVVDCVREEFARWNVTVTDSRPASGPYVMAMFGGNGSQLGYGRGIGGVAPIDPDDCAVIESAVAFIMTENLGANNAETICEVGAHEVGHTFSLDHELLAADPMTYLSFSGLQVFQDKAASCGEYSAKACVCRRPSQNSVQVLTQKLGAGGGTPPPPPPPGKAPTVAIVSPADGAALTANSTIQIVATATDDEGVSKVELLWKYNGATFACPGDACTQSGTSYTFSLNVGSGERRFQVRATDRSGLTATTPERVIQLRSGGGEELSIQVVEPVSGQEVTAGATVALKVDVKSRLDLRQVGMTWSGPAGSMTDSLTWQGGDRWSLNIRVSATAPAGPRQIAVFAEDVSGNRTTAPPVRLSLVR